MIVIFIFKALKDHQLNKFSDVFLLLSALAKQNVQNRAGEND